MGNQGTSAFSPLRRLRVVLVVGALLAVSAGGAYAAARLIAAPGDDGMIRACYDRRDGWLRLVNEGMRCRRSAAHISATVSPPTSGI